VKNTTSQYAADVRSGRRIVASVFRGIEKLIATSLKYSPDYNFMGDISQGRAKKARELMAKMFLATNQAQSPIAPSSKACSLYCKPAPGERGCVYCGRPKKSHTQEAIQKGGYA
jgi:hypothetical protein